MKRGCLSASRGVRAISRRLGVDKAGHARRKRDQAAVQDAFNTWREESGCSLTEISRILACSVP